VETWDLYNSRGEHQGISIQRGEAIPVGYYHRIIHVWIFNERNEFLIQQRAMHLTWFPGRWATTTGSVVSGESDLELAAYREVNEELGLGKTQIVLELVNELIVGHSIVTIFKAFLPSYMLQQLKINEEVADVRWMRKSKIEDLRSLCLFAEYSDEIFSIIYPILEKF
jgi:8-oxo-dGTP diphosphatase